MLFTFWNITIYMYLLLIKAHLSFTFHHQITLQSTSVVRVVWWFNHLTTAIALRISLSSRPETSVRLVRKWYNFNKLIQKPLWGPKGPNHRTDCSVKSHSPRHHTPTHFWIFVVGTNKFNKPKIILRETKPKLTVCVVVGKAHPSFTFHHQIALPSRTVVWVVCWFHHLTTAVA